jgi:hypothetical protein
MRSAKRSGSYRQPTHDSRDKVDERTDIASQLGLLISSGSAPSAVHNDFSGARHGFGCPHGVGDGPRPAAYKRAHCHAAARKRLQY